MMHDLKTDPEKAAQAKSDLGGEAERDPEDASGPIPGDATKLEDAAPPMAAPLHGWSSWERGAAPSPARAGSTVRIFPLLSAFLGSRYVASSSDAMD
jgi:hypothetical protein